MPYISKSSIQELTDRLDANVVVGDYVRLEKRGGRLWANCPFHQEKTASFTVNPDLKSYYCFGCHKGGTLINFVMEMDKISFPEAIELLAKKFAVELVYENSTNNISGEEEAVKKRNDGLLELYRRISGTFHYFLLKNPEAHYAKQYIISRGINSEMIERFGLGYSPLDRYWLHSFLSEKGYSEEFLALSGLFSSREKRASLFSGRLMFPINNRQGKTVAFGGRYLEGNSAQGTDPPTGPDDASFGSGEVSRVREGWQTPKYINSPELFFYKKRETLYALDIAMPQMRKTKTAYLAEGYLDVLALHQAGLTNAIAPLGTAFTDEQAKLLKRWVEKVIVFFDADEAGQAATLKAIHTCRKNGLDCAVVASAEASNPAASANPAVLSNSKDPADILLNFGPQVLYDKAKCFMGGFEYLLNRSRLLFAESGGKDKAVAQLFPYIELLDSEVARASCFEVITDTFALPEKAVADDYRRYTQGQRPLDRGGGVSLNQESQNPVNVNDELSLLAAVALEYLSSRSERLFFKLRSYMDISGIEDQNAKEIFITLEECIRYGEAGMDEFLARITSPVLKDFIIERSVSGEFSTNSEQFVNDGIKKIKMKGLENRQKEIIFKLRLLKKSSAKENTSEEALDSEAYGLEARELLSEKMQIDNELHQLKQGRMT